MHYLRYISYQLRRLNRILANIYRVMVMLFNMLRHGTPEIVNIVHKMSKDQLENIEIHKQIELLKKEFGVLQQINAAKAHAARIHRLVIEETHREIEKQNAILAIYQNEDNWVWQFVVDRENDIAQSGYMWNDQSGRVPWEITVGEKEDTEAEETEVKGWNVY